MSIASSLKDILTAIETTLEADGTLVAYCPATAITLGLREELKNVNSDFQIVIEPVRSWIADEDREFGLVALERHEIELHLKSIRTNATDPVVGTGSNKGIVDFVGDVLRVIEGRWRLGRPTITENVPSVEYLLDVLPTRYAIVTLIIAEEVS